MAASSSAVRVLRFGTFTLDLHSGELQRSGTKVRLAHQPYLLLRMLAERPAELVTREEIRAGLWPADTYVDFDVALNSVVRKLREALGDSADNPRFIETLPRHGYRFIAPVVRTGDVAADSSRSKAAGRWASFPRRMTIAASVVAALAGGWFLGVGNWRQPDPEASAAYLKGVRAAGDGTADGYIRAVKYFEEAVAREPGFAEAYARLAHAQTQLLYTGPYAPRAVVPKAEAAARTALRLDDRQALAHRTLGVILQRHHWRWEEARLAFRRAHALETTTVERHQRAGVGLIRTGHYDDAAAAFDRAFKADPMSPNALIEAGVTYRAAGQSDRALAAFRKAAGIAPRSGRAQFQLGITLLRMGRVDESIESLAAAAQLSGRNPRFLAYLGLAQVRAGQFEEARAILGELEARARQQYVSAFGIALIHDALGDLRTAQMWFERAFDERAVELAIMDEYPRFTTIAAEPAFQMRLQQIGRPPADDRRQP